MDNRDNPNLGDQIKSMVQDALDSMDYKKLNRDIGSTVNSALDEVRRNLGNAAGGWNGKMDQKINQKRNGGYQGWQHDQRSHSKQDNTYRAGSQKYGQSLPQKYAYQKGNKAPAVVSSSPAGSVSGILYTVFGSIGIGLFGLFGVMCFIMGVTLSGSSSFGALVASAVFLAATAAGFLMLARGISLRKRIKRFRRYVKQLGGRRYCTIKELSLHIDKPVKYVTKDIYRMIKLGMFPEAHLDEQKTCLMLDADTFTQYLKAQEAMRVRQLEEQRQKLSNTQKKKEKTEDTGTKSGMAELEAGKAYIKQIKEANDAIPGEEISNKLDRLEEVTSKIFDCVEQHPEQLNDIRKFMEYYLPTTLKLVNAYRELDAQLVQGENITTAKNEIQETLDTINTAFENLLDSLFENTAMDISTDISVLETMLKQEGLTEKDFTGMK